MPAGNPTLVPPSSDVELRALRRRCASALWALVPKGVGRLYFGGGLLRANPVLTMSRVKTEGSADSKTAAVGKLDNNGKDTDRGKGRPSFSLSSKEDVAKEKASAVETVPIQTTQAREQERSRSGSQPRSRRSAPVPRPKTGGQGSAAASADPPRPSPPLPPSKTSSASEEARTGMAPQDDENMSRQDRDHDHDDVHNDDNDDEEDDNNNNDDDEEILTEIEQCILDVFSDAYCNKHLVYGVLELILVRLLPELTEKVTLELWKERISV
ncbi:hypothetical protein MYCTH_49020 [Thermothelomyces thermophilus ATCC 42464]|uniref:PXA domain-containing protein n=1 Tax=Thermothelomyces thermophilus (strain ATCC 42464 / BCRC 31852 / DSM 1799) TaxID=573729 RepID=G2QEB9_THET4|nr:uncharacterized protein MYCTH_49020 [Thermothelomyces thermophilus ATCC 42464]AEO57702.1 hypothetical protein MYCTH_49020 [Thermothelomyces thermophilus ATCC 42464]